MRNALSDAGRRNDRCSEPRGPGGDVVIDEPREVDDAVDESSALVERRAESPKSIAMNRVREWVDPKSWEAFCRSSVDGLPAKAATGEIGLSVAAVCKHQFRIRRMVLAEYEHFTRDGPSAE